MSLEDDIAVLSRAALFHLLDRDALRLLAFASENRDLGEGETLFRRKDRSDGAYVVSRGVIALDAAEDGSSAPYRATPGTLIGQTALFTTVERPATATATEPCTVIRIDPAVMRRMLTEFPDAAEAMQQALADDLASLTEGLEQVRRRLLAIDGTGP
jgi:CRP-like cAMP-binding protein